MTASIQDDNTIPPEISEAKPYKEAEQTLERKVSSFFSSISTAPNTLIRCTPGLGKTQITLKHAVSYLHRHPGTQGVVLVPEHSLSDELIRRAQAIAGDHLAVSVWKGARQHCKNLELLEAVIETGGKNSDACDPCSYKTECPYHKQREKKAELWIGTHSLLPLNPPEVIDSEKLSFVVIDEAFHNALIRNKGQKTINVKVDDMPEIKTQNDDISYLAVEAAPWGNYFDRLIDIFRSEISWLDRETMKEKGITAKVCEDMESQLKFLRDVNTYPELPTDASAKQVHEHTKNFHERYQRAERIRLIWELLAKWLRGNEETCPYLRLEKRKDANNQYVRTVVPVWCDDIHEEWADVPFLHLDATASPAVAGRWLPGLVTHEVHARLPGTATIRHLDGMAATQKALVGGRGNANDQRAARNNRARLARLTEATGAALIGQKGMIEALQDEHPHAAPPERTAHFNALRGRNHLEDSRHLVVAGRTLPRDHDVARIASALTGRWIDPDERYQRVRRFLFHADGTPARTIDALEHPDPDAEAVRAQAADAEILQAVHRARPVNDDGGGVVIDVFSGDTAPAVPITTAASMDDVLPGPEALATARGVVPSTWRTLHAVVADHYTSPAAMKQVAYREAEPVTNLYYESNREMLRVHGQEWRTWTLREKGARKRFIAKVHPDLTQNDLERIMITRFDVAEPHDLQAESGTKSQPSHRAA